MKSKNIILRSLQILTAIALLSVLGLGFVTPVSITQGFILHPALALILLGGLTFAESKIDYPQRKAELHHLPTTAQRFHTPCDKAA